jgi:hypothetical protein
MPITDEELVERAKDLLAKVDPGVPGVGAGRAARGGGVGCSGCLAAAPAPCVGALVAGGEADRGAGHDLVR